MPVKITQNGIDTIQDGVVTAAAIADNSLTGVSMPAGSIVQIKRTLNTTTGAVTIGTTSTNIPGNAVTITPKYDNSKILVIARMMAETDSPWNVMYQIKKNGTIINQGGLTEWRDGLQSPQGTYASANNNDSTPECAQFTTLDTGVVQAGVPITYQMAMTADGTRTTYYNVNWANDRVNGNEYSTGEVTAIEIKVV